MKNKKKIIFLIGLIFLFFLNKNSYADNSLYELNANKVIYKNNNQLIIAEGEAQAKDQFGKKIFSQKIIYDKKNLTITTENQSTFLDSNGNKLFADSFIYNLNSKIINAIGKIKFIDKDGNIFYFTNLEYNENEEIGIGANLKGFLIDKSSVEGSQAKFNNKTGILIVGDNKSENIIENFFNIFKKKTNTYTPCKIYNDLSKTIEEKCPDWSLDDQKTVHDKKNKMVYHYGSLLKIKNIPVFYTPYFSHPDSTVKRKSGFLPPSIKNFTDLGQTIKIPYFWAINENQDLTFSPIYYFDEHPIFLTEYRQQNSNSKFYIDSSYTEGYKNLNKRDSENNPIQRNAGSKKHFFFNFLGNYDDILFNKNDLEINIQNISHKNYLSVNQINTSHVKQDINVLNNNIILNSYENNKKISIRGNIYENLSDENKSTKYQYNLPNIDFSNYFEKSNQKFSLHNSFAYNNLGGDSNQTYLNNTIGTTSNEQVFSFLDGVGHTFKTSLINLNKNNQNINNQKENFNINNYFTAAIESSYPLIKINNRSEQSIIPKIFNKFTTGSMENISSEKKKLNYEDIYSINRANNNSPETGASIGYGIEYNSINKNDKNEAYNKTTFAIGQVIAAENKHEMPSSSTLNKKRSAFAGYLKFNLDNEKKNDTKIVDKDKSELNSLKFDANYDFNISKDFNKLLQNSLITNLNYKNNILSANYYNSQEIDNKHYLQFNYQKKLENNFNILTGIRKNIEENFTESNFFEINYDTDCIKISFNLSKTFYKNEELKPSNNLNLTILLKPFGSPISPDIASLLN